MDSKERIAKALQIATDTKVFEMAPGASEMAPDIFKKLFPGRKAVIVADINTWPALGEKVYGMFLSAGIKTDKYIIDKKEFHAEWKYIEMVDKIIEGDYEAAKTLQALLTSSRPVLPVCRDRRIRGRILIFRSIHLVPECEADFYLPGSCGHHRRHRCDCCCT